MNVTQIVQKFYRDFKQEEIDNLGKKQMEIVQKMTKGDKVVVEDKLLDYLRDFFNELYDGNPITKTFETVLIEWHTAEHQIVNLYVHFPEEHPDWVYVDAFFGWRFLGKLLFPNVALSDEDRTETGQFMMYTPFLTEENFSLDFLNRLIPCIKDVFTYVFLYVEANKNVKKIYKEEMLPVVRQKSTPKSKGKKSQTPKKEERDKVYIPYRRVYKLEGKTAETEQCLREYVYARWKVRGYTYTRKNGTVVNVREHEAFRHFPNQGKVKEGKDFFLRKAD